MRFRFEFRRYRLPFRAVVRTSHGPWAEREGLIVRLEDASEGGSGAVGFGEVACIPWFGTETADEAAAECRRLGEWVEAEAFESVPARLRCLRNAIAGAREEIAAAVGAAEEKSPDASPTALGVAALLSAGRAALEQIPPKAEVGFRVFKWKVGVGDLSDELALLDDVCAALPSGGKLRLDANGAWDRRKAERWLERCADRPVEFVEQPCFARAEDGATAQRRVEDTLLGLASDFPTPIGLDESLVGDADLARWMAAGWPGVYVIKPSLFGDRSAALRRLEHARADVVFSSALETAVGAKAGLKAAFAWSERMQRPVGAVAGAPGSNVARNTDAPPRRAVGFGVWPLFADARFDGPASAPFVRFEDVAKIEASHLWNALS